MPHRNDDLLVVRRAGRRAALQAALLVAVSFALCAGLVLVVVVHGQDRDAARQLAVAVGRADDVSDPPDGVTLALRHPDGRTDLSPGAGTALPYQPAITAVLPRAAPALQVQDVHSAGGDFRIWTERRATAEGADVVQAAYALRPQQIERARLLAALGGAGALALLAAAALGALTGRRTVHGLVAALGRQRRFVADASHELRTPLTVLSTRTQVLGRHIAAAPLDTATRQLLSDDVDRLRADSARLADVVEDLLAASEPDAAGGESVDLAQVSAEVVTSLTPLGDEHQITVVLTRPDSSEGTVPGALEVQAHEAAVRRSLVALIDNALRHSPPGGTVTVTCFGDGKRAVVTVSDSGAGIPEAVRSRLFDRFSSGDRQSDGAAGPGGRRRYGLGLALVADTVHRFGGTIAVQSGVGGTTFSLTLPRGPHGPPNGHGQPPHGQPRQAPH